MIKDYGKLSSLKLMKFEGEDLKFYKDEIINYLIYLKSIFLLNIFTK